MSSPFSLVFFFGMGVTREDVGALRTRETLGKARAGLFPLKHLRG
jgi:hypothetical protein